MTYLVEYLRPVTPYPKGAQIPIMRRDRAEALVSAGVASAVGWTPGVAVEPPKTLQQIDPEGITVQAQSEAADKAPDAPLADKQIRHGFRNPLKPIRK